MGYLYGINIFNICRVIYCCRKLVLENYYSHIEIIEI